MMSRFVTTTDPFDPVETLDPIHPGEILKEEFLDEYDITPSAFATKLGVPRNQMTAIVNGTRGITAKSALILAKSLGTTAEFWMNLQTSYDLQVAKADAQNIAVIEQIEVLQYA